MLVGFSPGLAQKIESTSGVTFATSNTSLAYTIGEPLILTYQKADTRLTQGFHQPMYEDHAFKEGPAAQGTIEAGLQDNISIYPNPVRDRLTLNFHSDWDEVSVSLSDMHGKVLLQEQHQGGTQKIFVDLSHLPAQPMILQIRQSGSPHLETFQVIKINH